MSLDTACYNTAYKLTSGSIGYMTLKLSEHGSYVISDSWEKFANCSKGEETSLEELREFIQSFPRRSCRFGLMRFKISQGASGVDGILFVLSTPISASISERIKYRHLNNKIRDQLLEATGKPIIDLKIDFMGDLTLATLRNRINL